MMVPFKMESESEDLEKVRKFIENQTFVVQRQFQNVHRSALFMGIASVLWPWPIDDRTIYVMSSFMHR